MPVETPPLSIAAVERETGLSKDTLRVWERRYNFPQPTRDGAGERCYPPEQVEKLRILRILLDRGLRPGKMAGLDLDALRGMLESSAPSRDMSDDRSEAALRPDLMQLVDLCRGHRMDELRDALSQALMRLGMLRFVAEVAAPLTTLIGSAWAAGMLAVFEEHLYTEALQGVLRNAIAALPAASEARPRMLLTTVPGEEHGLGLLMTEAIAMLEGARCMSLGVQTPVGEIARAAQAQRIDIVALSFSRNMRQAQVQEALSNLRAALPDRVALWAGGRSPALQRHAWPGVKVLDLQEIGGAIAAWRDQAASDDAAPPSRLL